MVTMVIKLGIYSSAWTLKALHPMAIARIVKMWLNFGDRTKTDCV